MSSVSNYALRMARLSAQIFGEVVRPTDTKSMKVVKLFSEQPLAKKKEVYSWYPPHNTYYALMKKLRYFGLYRRRKKFSLENGSYGNRCLIVALKTRVK
uniref:Small ribosomal subunit protein mS33 n=1 Tax=Anas zonorhyncha TaxID=75864 RepID=A0A8B9VYG0_9AVES